MISRSFNLPDHKPETAHKPPHLQALILDDSTFDRRRISRLSQDSGMAIQMHEVSSLAAFQIALENTDFDIILVDYNLPEGNGIDAIEMVKKNARNADCPTVMVAGDSKASIAVKAMRLGCADYISKDSLTAENLHDAISSAIETTYEKTSGLTGVQEATNTILKTVTHEYSKLLQPELARLVRDMRALKSMLNDPDTNVPNDLEAIETRCIKISELVSAPTLVKGSKARLLDKLYKITNLQINGADHLDVV